MVQTVDPYYLLSRLKRKISILRFELIVFGLFVLFAGLYPVLLDHGTLPAFFQLLPTEGAGYRVVVMTLGGLAVILGLRASRT